MKSTNVLSVGLFIALLVAVVALYFANAARMEADQLRQRLVAAAKEAQGQEERARLSEQRMNEAVSATADLQARLDKYENISPSGLSPEMLASLEDRDLATVLREIDSLRNHADDALKNRKIADLWRDLFDYTVKKYKLHEIHETQASP